MMASPRIKEEYRGRRKGNGGGGGGIESSPV